MDSDTRHSGSSVAWAMQKEWKMEIKWLDNQFSPWAREKKLKKNSTLKVGILTVAFQLTIDSLGQELLNLCSSPVKWEW